jgi:23S rRNA (adenine2030-N6)-methyltransferase
MNYRHAFHAGNFADVLKHAVLALVLKYLRLKNQPFRVIDTHAGIGLYDLGAEEAQRTGEWQHGIGRLLSEESRSLPALEDLAPYLEAVRAVRERDGACAYPGSPLIAQHWLRDTDRMILNEKHPLDRPRLEAAIGRDRRIKILGLDGYVALNAHVPPPERRGLVLVDPPFEDKQEFAALMRGFARAYAKWPTGTYLLWYPLKNPEQSVSFVEAIRSLDLPRCLRIEQAVRGHEPNGPLYGSGLIVVNPPYLLGAQMRALLPELTILLAQNQGAFWCCDWFGTTQE